MHARGLNRASVRALLWPWEGARLGGVVALVCVMGGLLAFAALALSAAPVSAALPSEFGSGGSGAGQLSEPSGVAVDNDPSSPYFGDVYVTDRNDRVNVFTGEGVFIRAFGWDVDAEKPEEKLQECTSVTGCQAGSGGAGVGQLDEREFVNQGIAVDNAFEDPLDGSVGDVYVLDHNNGRVEKFDGEGHFLLQFAIPGGVSIAVGPTGTVYVGEAGAVQEYTPAGVKLGEPIKLEGAGAITGLAVNETDELYVTEAPFAEQLGETHPARHYSATGNPLGVFDPEPEGSARSVALGALGEVFINQQIWKTIRTQQIRGFNPVGVQVAAFATANGEARWEFAFGATDRALYVPNQSKVEVFVQPEPGPIVSGESVGGVEPTAAVVHGVVGPDAPESCGETHYHVEYAATEEYEVTKKYGHSVSLPEDVLPRSFEEDPVEVPLAGLAPSEGYHYRVVAFDECELEPVAHPGVKTTFTTDGGDATFTTQPPALVEAEFATDVRSTSATVHARINPLGSATSYRFVYGPSSACAGGECSVPAPDGQVGSGKAGVEVEQHLQGLTAGQAYHYRVVASNALEKMPGEVQGEERSFTTQAGGEAVLPDGREWELVSPPDKHGAELSGAEETSFIQAAASGNGIVYNASAPTESQPRGNGEEMQVLAQRSSSGWSDLDLAISHIFPVGVTPVRAYVAFSSELSVGVLEQHGGFEPALSKDATEQTPYLRDSATGVFTPLVTPADDTTHPFIPFGEEAGDGECLQVICGPVFAGATPDLSHIVLGHGFNNHNAPLLQGTPADSLYEWAGGKLALVSELPENPPAVSGGPTLGGNGGDQGSQVTAHAVSNDGSRIFWGVGNPPTRVLFMRDMARGETIEIGSGPAEFEGANAAGTLVFYSGRECEILAGVHLECRPVTGENNNPLEDGTVLSTSEDGSWVYFQQGASIYARHNNETARLVASNIGNIRPTSVEGINPQSDPWRAAPNGEWFAFMSDSSLTGYDNRDAVTGQPDEEVYLYNAAAGRLVCASCDPSGARPHGAPSGDLLLAVYAVGWGQQEKLSLAATVPGWAPYSSTHALYDPRFLSDSGRLFFNAVGGLVPRDVNGQVDTYQFEPPGVGGCGTATQTGTVVYSSVAGGCVALISNGESPEESVFEDASESGDDVFFLSSSRLSSGDLDGSRSLWDARVCAVGSPCLPVAVGRPPACGTEASCKASPSPQPVVFGAPASATFNGSGNVASSPALGLVGVGEKKALRCRRRFIKRGHRCVRSGRRRAGRSNHGGRSR